MVWESRHQKFNYKNPKDVRYDSCFSPQSSSLPVYPPFNLLDTLIAALSLLPL